MIQKMDEQITSLRRGLKDRRRTGRADLGELTRFFRACKDHSLSGPYVVGGEWADYLEERKDEIAAFSSEDEDVLRNVLENFWRNSLSPIAANYQYYKDLVSNRFLDSYVKKAMHDYAIWEALVGEDVERLAVPNIGNCWGMYVKDTLVVPQAFRFHRNATYILELLKETPEPVVAEIGGGYGGLATYLLRSSPGITYLNFDLPETLMLSAYYLREAFPDRKIFLFEGPGPIDRALVQEYDILLFPHHQLPQLGDDLVDLFHNAVSMSEMKVDTIAEYVRQIERATRQYFYHVNLDKPGIFNRGSERVPASCFPISPDRFRRLFRMYDPYFGPAGLYYEFLYETRGSR